MAVSPSCSFQDGAGPVTAVPASNLANVTPGNAVQISLTTPAGVQQWDLTIAGDYGPQAGLRYRATSSPFQFAFTPPQQGATYTITSECTDGANVYRTVFTVVALTANAGPGVVHRARNIVTGNVASLSAFTITAAALNDNVTGGNVQGDIVLLAAQSTASQNGLYVVGVVTSTTAPLTRAPDWTTGVVLPGGVTVEVSEGTIFGNSSWKLTTAGKCTVDTTSVNLYPRVQKGSVTLASGAGTASNLFALAGAAVTVTDTTGANADKGTLTAGAGNGSLALAGTGSDVLSYSVENY